MIQTQGFIQFDASTPEEFRDLVEQTLEESEFITTEWQEENPTDHPGPVLLVQEIDDE